MPVKMYNAGDRQTDTCCPEPSTAPRIYYPSLHLDGKQAPFLKGILPKKKVTLIVECEVKGIQIRMNPKESTDYSLDIKKIGILGKPAGASTAVERIVDGAKI